MRFDSNNQDSFISETNKKRISFIQDNQLVDELKKQISTPEKRNSQLNDQINEISHSQDRLNSNPQINRQSSEIFDNVMISPTHNDLNYDEDSNISLRNERDKMMNLLNRQNDLTSNLELRLRKANGEIEELREKNRNLTRDVMKKQQISDSYEVKIPDSAFSSAEFPLDLENMVAGIYKNPTLQITTKIRQIISVVTHYFKSKYEQIERDLKESKENCYKLTEKTNSLIDFLHKIMPYPNVNYNAILDDESARNSLKESIENLKNELISAQQDKIQLEQQYEEIAKKMKTNSFQELSNSIANLQLEHKEYKQFKKDARSKEDELIKSINDLQNEKQELIRANKAFEENIEKQKIRIKSLKAEFENQIKNNNEANQQEIQKLKNDNMTEIMQIKSQTENSINNLKLQHANQIDEINNKFAHELSIKNKEIEILTKENGNMKNEFDELTKKNNDKINELSTQNETLAQNIEKLKFVIKQLRIKKEKREKEIEFLKEQNSDNQKDIKDKLKTQKNEIQSRIEQLQQLRSKEAKEYSQNIGNLKIEIEQLVKERNELIVKNTNLSIQLQKLETKFNAFVSDRERERREFESKLLAQKNAAQTEISTKTDEIKAQFIEKKRELYQSFFKQLAPFLNFVASSSASENNFSSFIMDIRRKLEIASAREAKIREIFGLNSYESIEEALAKKINHLSRRKKTRIEL